MDALVSLFQDERGALEGGSPAHIVEHR